MYTSLMVLVIGLFVTLLFLNLYFRTKVLRVYKQLYQRQVQFDHRHIFSTSKMEAEIIPRYPDSADSIRMFARLIRQSIGIAVVLVLLICVASALLYIYR